MYYTDISPYSLDFSRNLASFICELTEVGLKF